MTFAKVREPKLDKLEKEEGRIIRPNKRKLYSRKGKLPYL